MITSFTPRSNEINDNIWIQDIKNQTSWQYRAAFTFNQLILNGININEILDTIF
jgi:hypothetical protein